MCICSVYFYTILTDCLLFDRCSLHGWSNMDCWIQRTVVYLSPVETGTSRQCESLLDVTCVYRVGPLKYVFLFEVTCRSREECLWVECLWVFVRGNLYVQYRTSRRCQVFVGHSTHLHSRTSQWMGVFVGVNMYVQSRSSGIYVCLLEVTYMYREGPLNMLVFVLGSIYV